MPVPEFKYDGGPTWQAPDLTGKKMLLWGLQYDPHIERYRILAQTFSDHTGATVEVQPQGWPLDQKIMTALALGTGPDVVCWMGVQSVPIIKQQSVVAVDDLNFKPLGLDVKKWFRPGASGAYFQDGKYWGVPVEDNGDGFSVTGDTGSRCSRRRWTPVHLGQRRKEHLVRQLRGNVGSGQGPVQKEDDKGNFEVMGLNRRAGTWSA